MSQGKVQMRMTIIGNTGSGRKTMAHRLINTLGSPKQQIATDIKPNKFETSKYCITIVEPPGHRDFIKSSITLPTQTNCAVLIVSAHIDEFQSSMSRDGLTREQILLSYTMGIRQLIVAVNKMDTEDVSYAEDRFDKIKTELLSYIIKVGYKPEHVIILPMSIRHDDNLFQPSDKMSWFKGFTLLEALNAVTVPEQLRDKPFRLPIQDVFNIRGVGTIIVGRVESGVLRPNMIVTFTPSNITTTVQSIEMHHESLEEAQPGDSIGFNVNDISVKGLRRGFVCSDARNDTAQITTSFIAKIIVINDSSEITQDYVARLHCHTARIDCRFVELLEKIDRITNKTLEIGPKYLKLGEAAIVKIVLLKPVCLEKFEQYPTLGRFAIHDIKHVIAVGTIKEVEKLNG
ncbi:hypothetical protein I4U23_004382 [Adineta vaga]|nr:hypothetical protein I4U23_004382 [Adineta vaga]